jgi:LDH2 family malate/lactate/ureidoglycolate dehydrogenase
MKNSLIFLITTTTNAVASNGIIPLQTIARRRGNVVEQSGNSIVLNRPGYYKINGSVTVSAQTAGIVTIEAEKSGIAIPGITSSETITTATTEVRTLNISGIIRVVCAEGAASITLVNTGVAINETNVSLDIEYLG